MIYVILVVLCSSSLYVSLKLSEKRTDNTYAVTMFNYLTAAVISLLFIAGEGFGGLELKTVGISAGGGVCYFVTMLMLFASIKKNGATLTTVFNRLGVLVPIFLSFTLFGEVLSVYNIIGVVLAVIASVIINFQKSKVNSTRISVSALILIVVFSGLCDVTPKFFSFYGNPADSGRFVFFIFLFAFIFAASALIFSGKKVNKYCLYYGCFGGIVNCFTTRLILAALDVLPSYVVYPVGSIGVVVVTSVLSRILFKEKMGKQQLVGIGIILVSLVFLNI